MKMIWRVLFPILIYTVITAVVVIGLMLFTSDAVVYTLAAALFTIPILGYFFQKDQKKRGKTLFAGGLSGKMMVFIILFGMAACVAVNNMISISRLSLLFPGYSQVSEILYNPALWLQIVSIGLVIPAVEELIFRGMIFAVLRERQSFWRAAIISSLIFGIYHGNMVQFVYAFVLGLMLCWVYEQTDSILGSVVFHQSANLLSVAVTAVMGESEAFGQGISLYLITIAATGMAVFAVREIKR